MEPSPRARKNQRAAAARARLWQPLASAHKGRLVIAHAINNRKNQQKTTARILLDLEFTWHGQPSRRRFEHDLTERNLHAAQVALFEAGITLTLGRTIEAWRREMSIPVSRRNGRKTLFKT